MTWESDLTVAFKYMMNSLTTAAIPRKTSEKDPRSLRLSPQSGWRFAKDIVEGQYV